MIYVDKQSMKICFGELIIAMCEFIDSMWPVKFLQFVDYASYYSTTAIVDMARIGDGKPIPIMALHLEARSLVITMWAAYVMDLYDNSLSAKEPVQTVEEALANVHSELYAIWIKVKYVLDDESINKWREAFIRSCSGQVDVYRMLKGKRLPLEER